MGRSRREVCAVGLVLLGAAVWSALDWHTKDLLVYQHAGRAVIDGLHLYDSDDPVTGLPFTYPPFAAVAMVPLVLAPTWLLSATWTAVSAGCLAAVVVTVRRSYGRPTPAVLLGLVLVCSLALEPVWQNLTFGQVNAVLMLVVLADMLHPDRRFSGVLVGIAAGVKLTPLVFVVLLLLVGRRSAAGRAAATFVATVVVGFVVMPSSSATYWTDRLVDPGRVGPPALAHNQSVSGALARMLGGPPPTLLWLVVAGTLSAAVLLVAVACWRRGDPALATCLGALAMLLASPVSWSHHWVWAVPVALVLWERSRWAAAAWSAVFVLRPVLWPPWGEGREYDWSPWEHVLGNGYLLAALALAAGVLARFVSRPAPPGGPPPRPPAARTSRRRCGPRPRSRRARPAPERGPPPAR